MCVAHSESESEAAQSCPTRRDPVDGSLPGSSDRGILQARILEWVAISFSRGSSQTRDRNRGSRTGGRCLNLWATREAIVGTPIFAGEWIIDVFLHNLLNIVFNGLSRSCTVVDLAVTLLLDIWLFPFFSLS